MKILNGFRIIGLALAVTVAPANARDIKANGGTTFELTPSITPGALINSANGPARVSVVGNCTLRIDEIVTLPTAPDQHIRIKALWRFTSADGATILDTEVEGPGIPDPANPSFVNIHYKLKFTGGTGRMANAKGRAEVDVLAMFTSATGGTAAWSLDRLVFTHGLKSPSDKDSK